VFSCAHFIQAAEEQQSLLQAKLHRATSNPLEELKAGGNRAQVSSLLESMAVDSIADGNSASPDTVAVLATILASLKSIQDDDILKSHTTDQTDLNNMVKGFTAAATTLTSSQSGDASNFDADIAQLESTHSTCRIEHEAANVAKDASCKDLEQFIAGVNTPACTVPGRGGNKNGEYFANLQTDIDLYKTNWATKEAACTAAEIATWTTKNNVCNHDQEEFEKKVCNYRNEIHLTCSTYGTTYDTKLSGFNSAVDAAEVRADGRKVEWKAIAKIVCFIDTIKSDADAAARTAQLATCRSNDASTVQLDLVRPTVPAKLLCSFAKVSPHPCSSEFETKYYDGLYFCKESECAVHTCSACTDLPAETLRTYSNMAYDTLAVGNTLSSGDKLVSASGNVRLEMQAADGNLVLYSSGNSIWSSESMGHAGAELRLQGDGNLVLRDGSTALWSSGSASGAARVQLQDDCNLVTTDASGTELWSLGTTCSQ